MKANSSIPELLTVEQLAERIQVSRATLFTWMQKGILVAGQHYFKQGRVLRFLWSSELIQELIAGSETTQAKRSIRAHVVPPSRGQANPINWDY